MTAPASAIIGLAYVDVSCFCNYLAVLLTNWPDIPYYLRQWSGIYMAEDYTAKNMSGFPSSGVYVHLLRYDSFFLLLCFMGTVYLNEKK